MCLTTKSGNTMAITENCEGFAASTKRKFLSNIGTGKVDIYFAMFAKRSYSSILLISLIILFGFSIAGIGNANVPKITAINKVKWHDAGGEIPTNFDWREKNIMTPVKHQMNLGSCGVFAAVAVFESLIKKETGKTVDLSEQQVINGSKDFLPSGISSVDAMKYIKQHGLVLEERLPYQDKKTEKMPDGPADYILTDYHYVQTDKLTLVEKIKTIKRAVLKHGPVATNMIFYQDLDRYKNGIYVYDGKSDEQGGHWVVIIGWKDDPDAENGGYWVCRNSWGPKWGEDGYFKIAYGQCGIDDFWFVYGIYEL